MQPDIKFCGITREQDAEAAGRIGASFVGTILAGGPRQVTPGRAKEILSVVRAPVRRVGVFGDASAREITAAASLCALDVVQLHGAGGLKVLSQVREAFHGDVWVAIRIAGSSLPVELSAAFEQADAVVLDKYVEGILGGTGSALPWGVLAERLRPMRSRGRLALAGGLRPENVAEAIACLEPDIVDVSSGVESAPGVKDHARMRAFRDAVLRSAAA